MAPGSRRDLGGLERYAEYFNAVELNSTFYREPRSSTLERWRESTPPQFRFSAKLPRAITHEAGLIDAAGQVDAFCALMAHLSPKLRVLLVQLPRSLELDVRTAGRFFRRLRAEAPAAVVVEPRHPSWFSTRADELLAKLGVGRAAADPALCPSAADPGGQSVVSYFRWHGSPRMYFSAYSDAALRSLAVRAESHRSRGREVYCIFDNTALGAAAINALALRGELRHARRRGARPWHSSCLVEGSRPSQRREKALPFSEDWSLPMKATALLESQHRKVEALFKKLEGGRSDPGPVLEELANNLAAHMAIEQDIFYPAVKEVDEDVVNESYEEHSIAELALKRLLATDPEDEAFHARVTTLKELIEHHVEEEEQELFPEVEKTVDEDMLSKLGKEMKARFDEVYEGGYEAAVPKGMTKTSADASSRGVAKGKKSHKAA